MTDKFLFIPGKCWLAGTIIILFSLITNAQDNAIIFKQITVNEGLSQSWVHCICQDTFGYIWFGTDDGLNQYNGYEMISYKYNTRDKNTIDNSSVLSLCSDSRGDLWIGTVVGLNHYDRKRGLFISDSSWPKNMVTSIVEDDQQNLWIGTHSNLFYYNTTTQTFTEYKPNIIANRAVINKGYIGSAYINIVYIDSHKHVWIGTNDGLNLFVKETNSFINYFHSDHDPESLGNNNINSIYEDHTGRLWLGHQGGLDLFVNAVSLPRNGQFRHFIHKNDNSESISRGSVLGITEDVENNLWVGVDNGGLNLLNLSSIDQIPVKFVHYRNIPGLTTSLSNNSVYCLYKDNQQNIWVGTYGNGVSFYNPIKDKFKLFRSVPSVPNTLNNNQVNAFLEDGDFIWIGTEGGLNRYNKTDKTFKYYTNNPKDNTSLGSNAVWAIHKDTKGALWIGTWAGGLNKLNTHTERFTRYQFNPSDTTSLGSNNVFAIHEDDEGKLWLGTMDGGLNMYDPASNMFIRYNTLNSDISFDYVESIIETKNGDLWMANLPTLARFNIKTRKFHNYIHDARDSASISGNKIFVVFADSKSNIWIGTDVGLNLYLPITDKFMSYQVQDGLPDNAIKSIVEDKQGNLWFGTNKGLSEFINAVNLPKTPKFKNYSKEDGLQGNEFNRRSCLLGADGKLYFGGENGLIVFSPDDMKENTFVPPVVFSDFLLFNNSVEIGKEGSPLTKDICVTKSIKLNPKQSVFTIKFVALNYVVPEKNQYAYILKGFESKWNYVGTKREVTYTNLPPGNYIFRVKASNNDGYWNETGASIQLVILPPWWKTNWFIILAVLSIISFFTGFYLYRVHALNKQKAYLEKVVQQRTCEIEGTNKKLVSQTNELYEVNTLLEERNQFIEEQNQVLIDKTEKLNESNALLSQQKKRFEELSEELQTQADNLQEKNYLLNERQEQIEKQSAELSINNEQLKTLNATKDKFFSIIAHDLKNPFSTIIGFSELLVNNYHSYDDDKKFTFFNLIYASSKNIFNLLENLLQWAGSQTGRLHYNPEEFALNELVQTNVKLLENMISEKKLSIDNQVSDNKLVYADRNMINTVVRNLITNAIKFTEKGEISLSACENGNYLKMTIQDTGVGMSKEKLKDLFSVGTSEPSKGTRGESGTGLGLILCKEFVEKNGGEITVESDENKGTSFSFTIPVLQK